MSQSIKQRIAAIPDHLTGKELKPVLDAILTDITALQTSVNGIATKLDADATVTDTNYNALHGITALETAS